MEVGPRDDLPNEQTLVPAVAKAELACRTIAAEVCRIEVTGSVNPTGVLQMADAGEFVWLLGRPDEINRIGPVLNQNGTVRAIVSGRGQMSAAAAP